MAGYVKLQRSIWTDPDFVALDASAQRLYLLLISQHDITHVGLLPLMPTRWANLAADTPTVDVTLALRVLEDAGFIATDEQTGELLVRTYLVHDGAHKLTNGVKSLVNAHGRVFSPRLRNIIRDVLATVDVTVAPTVDPTVTATVEVSHKPSTVRNEPAPAPEESVNGGGGLHPKQVAHDAAELLMQHEPNVQKPGAWKAKVADRLLSQYDIPALIQLHGDEAALKLYEVEAPREPVTVPNPYAPRPVEHDPDCLDCAGSGWRTIDPDRNVVDVCPCTPPTAIAPVVPIRQEHTA